MPEDTPSLEYIGRTLLAIQAEQRTLRDENKLIRQELGKLASRDEVLRVLDVLADRISDLEALTRAQFAMLERRFDRLSSGPNPKGEV